MRNGVKNVCWFLSRHVRWYVWVFLPLFKFQVGENSGQSSSLKFSLPLEFKSHHEFYYFELNFLQSSNLFALHRNLEILLKKADKMVGNYFYTSISRAITGRKTPTHRLNSNRSSECWFYRRYISNPRLASRRIHFEPDLTSFRNFFLFGAPLFAGLVFPRSMYWQLLASGRTFYYKQLISMFCIEIPTPRQGDLRRVRKGLRGCSQMGKTFYVNWISKFDEQLYS